MEGSEVGTCRLCGAEIAFIKCPNNHFVAVEPEPIWVQWDRTGGKYLMDNGCYITGIEVGDAAEGPNIRQAWIKHARVCQGRKRR